MTSVAELVDRLDKAILQQKAAQSVLDDQIELWEQSLDRVVIDSVVGRRCYNVEWFPSTEVLRSEEARIAKLLESDLATAVESLTRLPLSPEVSTKAISELQALFDTDRRDLAGKIALAAHYLETPEVIAAEKASSRADGAVGLKINDLMGHKPADESEALALSRAVAWVRSEFVITDRPIEIEQRH